MRANDAQASFDVTNKQSNRSIVSCGPLRIGFPNRLVRRGAHRLANEMRTGFLRSNLLDGYIPGLPRLLDDELGRSLDQRHDNNAIAAGE
jgi:hypothetical protein